jgi:hypothetical protein
MEQDKTDRILEVLLARMDADKAQSMANQDKMEAERKADKAEMMAEMKTLFGGGEGTDSRRNRGERTKLGIHLCHHFGFVGFPFCLHLVLVGH